MSDGLLHDFFIGKVHHSIMKIVRVAADAWVVPPVLTMVAAWSGFIAAVLLPSRTTGDLLAGMWQLLSTNFKAVPKTLV